MAKLDFSSGWSMGQDFISSMKAGANREKSEWRDKEAKKEFRVRKKGGYYKDGTWKPTKEQKKQIDEAKKRDKERGWDKSDMSEAGKLEKQFIDAHESSKGPLAGGALAKEKAELLKIKSAAKSARGIAMQDISKGKLAKRTEKNTTDDDIQQEIKIKLRQQRANAKSTEATAYKTQEEAEQVEANAILDREVKDRTSKAAEINAKANLQDSIVNLNKYNDSKTLAENTTKQMKAYDDGVRALRERLASGPPEDTTVDDWITGLKKEYYKLGGYSGPIQAVRDYIGNKNQSFIDEIDATRKSLFEEQSYFTKDNLTMVREIGLKGVKLHGMEDELNRARNENGDLGANDLIVRHWMLNDVLRSGLPISMLDEDPSNHHSKMFKYIVPQGKPFLTVTDKDGRQAVALDANGNPKENRLLDLGSTIAAYKDAKRIELQKRGKVTVSRQENIYGDPVDGSSGGDALSSALGQGASPRTGPLEETMRVQGPSFQINKGQPLTPQDKEIAVDADAVWEFLRPEGKTWEVGGGLFSFDGPKPEPSDSEATKPETSDNIPVDPVTGIPDIPPPRIKIPIPEPIPPVQSLRDSRYKLPSYKGKQGMDKEKTPPLEEFFRKDPELIKLNDSYRRWHDRWVSRTEKMSNSEASEIDSKLKSLSVKIEKRESELRKAVDRLSQEK